MDEEHTEHAAEADLHGAADSHADGTVEVIDAGHGGDHADDAAAVTVDFEMMITVWIVFGLLLAVLYKFGFKAILANLDRREADIRQSVEEAQRIHQEMAELEQRRAELTAEAEAHAKQIMAEARRSADDLARNIREKANGEARIMIENARREIQDAERTARANLRRESADLAVELASRLVQKNLDDEASQTLTEQLIRDL